MLKPQKISERLERTSHYIRPSGRPLMRVWHFLHGPVIMCPITYAIAVSSVASSVYYEIEEKQLIATFFFGIIFASFGEPIALWHQRRLQVTHLSDLLISAAETLEEHSTPDQMRQMNKVTRLARIILYLYIGDVSMCVVNYVTFPLQTGSLAANLPFLPDEPIYFWTACALQAYIEAAGSICFGTFLSYHTETSLLMTSMFNILGQQIESAQSREDVDLCIGVHQRLVKASLQFQYLFSRSWACLMVVSMFVLTVNTYIIIVAGSAEPVYAVLVFTILSILFAPCFLSDMVSIAFAHVGEAAYRSNWIGKSPDIQRDLALVTLRSQREFFFTAGIFGTLNMPKYQAILKRWYTLAQALIKTG